MLRCGILLGLGAALGASAEAPNLAQLRYREVFLGDLPIVAGQYESLYLGPPSSGVSDLDRFHAAFRAGITFEKLDRRDNAKLAYTWLIEPAKRRATSGDGGSSIAVSPIDRILSEAGLRLAALDSPGLVAVGGSEPVPQTSGTAGGASFAGRVARGLLDRLKAREGPLNEAALSLESQIVFRRERVEERRELVERLEGLGVTLRFGLPSVLEPNATLRLADELRGVLPAALDASKFQSALAARCLDRAALKLTGGDLPGGWLELRRAVALQGEAGKASGSFAGLLGAAVPAREDAASLASRFLIDSRLRREGGLRREVRKRVLEAERVLEERGRVDLAVDALELVRELRDGSPAAVRETPELAALFRRAAALLQFIARGQGMDSVLVSAWMGSAREFEKVLRLCEEYLELVEEEHRLGGPGVLAGRVDAFAASRGELDRLVHAVRDAVERGDRLRGQRAIRDVAALVAWVPALDPPGEAETLVERLRRDVAGRTQERLEKETREPPAAGKEGGRGS